MAYDYAQFDAWRRGRYHPECRYMSKAEHFLCAAPGAMVFLDGWERNKRSEFLDEVRRFQEKLWVKCACGHAPQLHVRGGGCCGSRPDLITAPDPPDCSCRIGLEQAGFSAPAVTTAPVVVMGSVCTCGHGIAEHISRVGLRHCSGAVAIRGHCDCLVFKPPVDSRWRGVLDDDFFRVLRGG